VVIISGVSYSRVKNSLLLANFISNAIGVAVIIFLSRGMVKIFSPDIMQLANRITFVFIPFSLMVPLVIILIYQWPIRHYLYGLRDHKPHSEETILRARKKLLNEPFFPIGLDSVIWLTAAGIYTVMFWIHGAGRGMIAETFLQCLFTGLITVTIAFFVLEFVLQRRVAPSFFPEGGLSMTPGTLRIRIRTRLIALLLAINIVPLVAILDDFFTIFPDGEYSYQTMQQLQFSIFAQIFMFICVGIWMIFLVSSNLTRPFEEIINNST
jgi:hypothetical protein